MEPDNNSPFKLRTTKLNYTAYYFLILALMIIIATILFIAYHSTSVLMYYLAIGLFFLWFGWKASNYIKLKKRMRKWDRVNYIIGFILPIITVVSIMTISVGLVFIGSYIILASLFGSFLWIGWVISDLKVIIKEKIKTSRQEKIATIIGFITCVCFPLGFFIFFFEASFGVQEIDYMGLYIYIGAQFLSFIWIMYNIAALVKIWKTQKEDFQEILNQLEQEEEEEQVEEIEKTEKILCSKFCPICGEGLSEQNHNICPNCGNLVK